MDRWRGPLIAVVAAGWLFNLVAPAFIGSYEASLPANAPLLLILGAVFAAKRKE